MRRLQAEYAPRGVNLVRIGNKWAFRTANDLAWLLTHEAIQPKKLSRAALETLAIVAYHLARPAYKLGMSELKVGRRDYELDVKVVPTQSTFKVREKATVAIAVKDASGAPAANGASAMTPIKPT